MYAEQKLLDLTRNVVVITTAGRQPCALQSDET